MGNSEPTSKEPDENASAASPIFVSTVFFVAAAVLVFVGYTLDQEDASNMQGIQRLLFMVISIRWFSWVFAAIFAGIGIWVLKTGREEESPQE